MASTTLTSHRFRSFLADDSLSLRSFRRPQSPTPSLKASSLKNSTPFAKILNSSRKGPAHETTYQPTLKDLSRPSFDEKDLTLAIGLPLLLPEMPHHSKASNVSTPNSVAREDSQPARSKPKTIIRMLTTKFSSRSSAVSPTTSTPPPLAPQTASAKGKRDAALRARGLLPPLPLSIQEAQLDRQLPVVSSPTAAMAAASHSSSTISEADRIKSEWEAKNKSTEALQRDRLAAFKFGGNASSSSVNKPSSPTSPIDPTRPDSPLLKSSLDLPTPLSPPPSSHRPLATTQLEGDNAPSSSSRRPTGLTIPEVEAYLVPLPASPSPSKLHVDILSVVSSIEPTSPTEKLDHTDSLASGAIDASRNIADSGVADSPAKQLPPPQSPSPSAINTAETSVELASPTLLNSLCSTPTPTSSATETITTPTILQEQVHTPPEVFLTPPATPSEPSNSKPLGNFKSSIKTATTGDEGTSSASSGSAPASPSISDLASPGTASDSAEAPLSILRSDSVEASILAPSLSSDSGTSESTSSSSAGPVLGTSVKGTSSTSSPFERLGGLTVNTPEGSNGPAIVESPVVGLDDFMVPKFSFEGLDVVVEEPESRVGSPLASAETPKSKLSLAVDVIGVNDEAEANPVRPLRTSSPEPMSPISPRTPLKSPTAGGFSAQQAQRRHVTDPVDRRRSVFRSFKRSTTKDAASERENEEPPTSPTLKSRGMFSSVRKSVVGSISGGRMKRSATTVPVTVDAVGAKAFNASGLPASPTLPSKFAASPTTATARERSTSRDRVSQTSKDTTGAHRQAIAPPMYNRGSILIEASAIEDEESRRMTEMAFLN